MSLFKRGGVWWSYVWVDGFRHGKSTGTGNRRAAEDFDYNHKEELKQKQHQTVQTQPEMPFEILAGRFLATCQSKVYYGFCLRQLLPVLGTQPIGQINKATAAAYRLERHRQKQVTDATINRELGALRHILYWAVDEGLLAQNPLTRLRLVRERKQRRTVISVSEEEQLLNVAPIHLKHLIIAALDTGMRRGELFHQKWEDVDLTRGVLFVTHSKTPEGESREIPLTDRMVRLLEDRREKAGLIFTYQGKAIEAIKTAWRTAVSKSNIRPLRFHDLRHSFATHLMEAGVMQEVRMALMGHSSGESVHATYTHVELPIKREAIKKLEAWRGQQSDTTEFQAQGGVLVHWPKTS